MYIRKDFNQKIFARKEGWKEGGREGRKEGKGVMLKEAGSYEETRHWK